MQVHRLLLFIAVCCAIKSNAQVRMSVPPPPVDTVPIGKVGSDSARIFEKVEVEATFPGGDATWRKYLESNLKPIVPIENGAPVGKYTVWAQFIVDKDGAISDVKALTKLGYGMEQEVIRIIRKGPRWVPAMQSGRPVKAYRRQPVTFIVTAEAFEIRSTKEFTLYADIDNQVIVTAGRVKGDDIDLRISEGSVTSLGDGVFNVRVNKVGRVLVEVRNKKKNRKIGEASMEVLAKN